MIFFDTISTIFKEDKSMTDFFPMRHSQNHHEILFGDQKGKMAVMFGLSAQGYEDFVERALDDGAGWTEIARVIGWINYSVFTSYYKKKYNDVFEKHNVHLIKPAHGFQKGWFLYDQKNKIWTMMEETIEAEGLYSLPKPCVKRIILRPKTGTDLFLVLNDINENIHLDFNMTESHPFNEICFHCYMSKSDNKIEVKSENPIFLADMILDFQEQGYILTDEVFFDLPSINNADKLCLNKDSKQYFVEKGILFS